MFDLPWKFKCKAGLSPPVFAAVRHPKHETRADNRDDV